MPENLKILPEIPVELPEKEVLFRLGGKPGTMQNDADVSASIRRNAYRAFGFCKPQGRWCVVQIQSIRDTGLLLENNLFLPGGMFARTCTGCTRLWCAAVTVGRAVTDARDALPSVAERSIYDAVASETADAAMNQIHRTAAREMIRFGLHLSERRYSAGYGDMPLSAQRLTDSFLHLHEMGITLNEHDFMTPEKSVTAWAGIRDMTGESHNESN